MVEIDFVRVIISILISFALSWRGYKKKSLSTDGALLAFVVGFLHTMAGYTFTVGLAVFFFTSSWLTKYKSSEKSKIEADHKEGTRFGTSAFPSDPVWRTGGQRTAIQVFSNSGIATIICVLHIVYAGFGHQRAIDWTLSDPVTLVPSALLIAFIGHYACANGDTWSSELGVLSNGSPVLITKCKRVPKGTNGGVSMLGLVASLAAGLVIGLSLYGSSLIFSFTSDQPHQWLVIPLATLCGILGSLFDSLLGATLQYSGFDEAQRKVVNEPSKTTKWISGINFLDNHQVNLISILMTTVAAPIVALGLYPLVARL